MSHKSTPPPTPPSPDHGVQMTAAADVARYILAQVSGPDMPKRMEQDTRAAFAAAGLADIVGVILQVTDQHSIDRYQTLFGGTAEVEERTGPVDVYLEHRLITQVRGVPVLVWATSGHLLHPGPRRARVAAYFRPAYPALDGAPASTSEHAAAAPGGES